MIESTSQSFKKILQSQSQKSQVKMDNRKSGIVEVKSIFPKRRQDIFAEDSWGYKDSFFQYNKKDGALYLRGKK